MYLYAHFGIVIVYAICMPLDKKRNMCYTVIMAEELLDGFNSNEGLEARRDGSRSLRVSTKRFATGEFIDARWFYPVRGGAGWRHSSKGLCARAEAWADLIPLVMEMSGDRLLTDRVIGDLIQLRDREGGFGDGGI